MEKRKSKSEILKKRAQKKPRSLLFRLIKWGLVLCLLFSIAAGIALLGLFSYLSQDLPEIKSLTDYKPPLITTVFSSDSRKVAEFYRQRRIILPLKEMPQQLINAFIAAEDARFYQHQGIDPLSIARAFKKNLEAGRIVQGGSTITQQVTRSFFLTPEKSYTRKAKEAILAYRINKTFSKQEVLFLYLNQIYLGHGAYGVEAASENYFGKSAQNLNLAECAILAGLPQAPSLDSPFHHPERAKQRQIYVLNRMVEEGYITEIEAAEAIDQELDIKPRRNWYIEKVPYYTEHVRRYVEDKYGADMLYEGGLKIYTAVNIEMQKAARKAIDDGLRALDKRHGYRGPLKHLETEEIEPFCQKISAELEKTPIQPGLIVEGVVIDTESKPNAVVVKVGGRQGILKSADMRWALRSGSSPQSLFKKGDQIWVRIKAEPEKAKPEKEQPDTKKDAPAPTPAPQPLSLSLEQTPEVQSALVCIEAETGHVDAMVGGRDFTQSQFNRAVQSRRQPGSAFKPFIYSAALDRGPTTATGPKGYTPATLVNDTAVVYKVEGAKAWKPKNYDRKYLGPMLLWRALAKSRNTVTVALLQDIGIEYGIDYAKKFGFTSEIEYYLSSALGTAGVSLLEMTAAYSVFANLGYHIKPVFITRIVDRDGNVIEEADYHRKKVIEKNTAYVMTQLLRGVVEHGTGWRVKKALDRIAAGKTGTTNNLFDAWFMGYTPRYITGVWVGYDQERFLGRGETGSRAASPIWIEFMQSVLENKPKMDFQSPQEVVVYKIDAKTGLLPIPESEKTITLYFKEGAAPTEHTPKPGAITDSEEFFKSGI